MPKLIAASDEIEYRELLNMSAGIAGGGVLAAFFPWWVVICWGMVAFAWIVARQMMRNR